MYDLTRRDGFHFSGVDDVYVLDIGHVAAGIVSISSDQEPLEVANRATQHLYIVNPIKKLDERSSGLMSTHPPIRERVDRLRALSGQPPLDAAAEQGLAGLS